MICILVRHGKDDETIRGGWSQHPLSAEGVIQAEMLANRLLNEKEVFSLTRIYSSDLERAAQTAEIIAHRLGLPVILLPQFREVNNGILAGMKNQLAQEQFPGMFWNQMSWEQCYPMGESPRQFYERVRQAWNLFSGELASCNENVLLVTHGGVIQVILSLLNNAKYTNKAPFRKIPHAGIIVLQYKDGQWREQKDNEMDS